MNFLSSLFGMGGGGGGGLTISPTETSGTGPTTAGSSAYGASGGGINVLSPGSGTFNIGTAGIILLALVALVGIIFIVREI
jgi:hypothetical protein